MAITKSGKKAHRQSLKKRVINIRRSNTMKDSIKAVREDIMKNAKGDAMSKLKEAYQALDKAAKRGVIKKGQADRKKSRLAKAIAKLSK
jgi:small subunit ribosomal protein S20